MTQILDSLPMDLEHTIPRQQLLGNVMKVALITGGVAGNHTVNGIAVGDKLVAVLEQDGTTGQLTDRTSEFSITAANTVNNSGGTDTTGDKLLVVWEDLT